MSLSTQLCHLDVMKNKKTVAQYQSQALHAFTIRSGKLLSFPERMTDLSDFERGMIIGMSCPGCSVTENC